MILQRTKINRQKKKENMSTQIRMVDAVTNLSWLTVSNKRFSRVVKKRLKICLNIAITSFK